MGKNHIGGQTKTSGKEPHGGKSKLVRTNNKGPDWDWQEQTTRGQIGTGRNKPPGVKPRLVGTNHIRGIPRLIKTNQVVQTNWQDQKRGTKLTSGNNKVVGPRLSGTSHGEQARVERRQTCRRRE